jgi:hypothetical protein
METKNPIEGVRLRGAAASLRGRDDGLAAYVYSGPARGGREQEWRPGWRAGA